MRLKSRREGAGEVAQQLRAPRVGHQHQQGTHMCIQENHSNVSYKEMSLLR